VAHLMTFIGILLFVIVLIIMIIGLAGVILPVLPGIPLIFGAAVLYGILTRFEEITLQLVLIFAGMTIFGLIVDYLANYFSVRKMGGGRAGAFGAVIGLMIGIWFGLVWIIVLPFALAVAFELIAGREARQAITAGFGSFMGLLFGGLTRFVIGCVMIGIFVWRVLF
jgi:uncharacterized protein YqgC (DUF456 family)